jgi:proteasome lid subunit RPN8/RPN11
MTIKEALQYFVNQSLFCRTIEICGFLGRKDGEYECRIVKNKHPKPSEFFSIDPVEYLKFSREFEFVAIFHSHIQGDSSASDFDKVNSDNTLVPFLIYSIPEKKFGLYEPPEHESDVTELKANI